MMEATAAPATILDGSDPSGVRDARVVVQARDVAVAFGGHRVLDGLDFELLRGELVLLRGANGSGKTVLLNVLSGHLAADRGSIGLRLHDAWWQPSRVGPVALARRGLGRLWQDIRLFPTLSAIENVLAATAPLMGNDPGLALLAWPWRARQERVARTRALENLARVGMTDRADSSCDMLSVGQMKRVALARLLQMNATLLLLDEPLAGLDAAAAEAVARDIAALCHDQGLTALVVEHRPDAFQGAADRVWTLRDGHLDDGGASRG